MKYLAQVQKVKTYHIHYMPYCLVLIADTILHYRAQLYALRQRRYHNGDSDCVR